MISANAKSASRELDTLDSHLSRIQTKLGGLNSSSIRTLGVNVGVLSSGVTQLKTANNNVGWNKIANGLNKISTIKTAQLSSTAKGINDIASSVGKLSSSSGVDSSINNLINSLSRLSNANPSKNLTRQSLESLGDGLASLQNKIAGASSVDKSTSTLVSSLAKLSNAGQNAVVTRQNLGKLGNGLLYIAQTLASAPQVSAEMITLTSSIAQLANAGQRARLSASGLGELSTQLSNLIATLAQAPAVSGNTTALVNSIASLSNSGTRVGGTLNSLSSYSGNNANLFNKLAQKGIDKVNSALNKFSIFGNKASSSAVALASKIGLLYANFFWVSRAIKGVLSAVDSTGDYIEAYNFFDVAATSNVQEYGGWEEAGYESGEAYVRGLELSLADLNAKMSGFTQDVSDGSGEFALNMANGALKTNLGINLTELTQFQAEIVSLGSSMGITTSATFDMAKGLSMLSADMSSLHNMDLDTVMQNFESGLIGQSRALYKYGIDITNASLAQTALNYGVSKSVSEMTQAEKAQLRFLAIIAQSKNAWGDLSNTVGQFANQCRILKSGLSNLAMTIGKILLPVVETVLPYLNALVKVLQWIFNLIAGLLGIKLSKGNTGTSSLEDLGASADDTAGSLDDATDSANELKDTVLGIDELNINNPNSDSGSGSGSGSGGGGSLDLSNEIADALAEYQAAWDKALAGVNDKSTQMANAIITGIQESFADNGFEGVGKFIGDGIADQIAKINWKKVYKGASNFGTELASFLNGLISSDLFVETARLIASCLNTAIYTWLTFSTTFDWSNFGKTLAESVNTFFETFDFKALGQGINAWVNGLVDTIVSFLANVKPEDIWKGFIDVISQFNLTTWNVILSIGTLKLGLKLAGAALTNSVLSAQIANKFTKVLGAKGASSIALTIAGLVVAFEGILFTFEGAKNGDLAAGLTGSLLSGLGVMMLGGSPQIALGTMIVTGTIVIASKLQKSFNSFKESILHPFKNYAPLSDPNALDIGEIKISATTNLDNALQQKGQQEVEKNLNNNGNIGATGNYSAYVGIDSTGLNSLIADIQSLPEYIDIKTRAWWDESGSTSWIGKLLSSVGDFGQGVIDLSCNILTAIGEGAHSAGQAILNVLDFLFGTTDAQAATLNTDVAFGEKEDNWVSRVIHFFFGNGNDGQVGNAESKMTFSNAVSDWVSKVTNFFFGSGSDGKTASTTSKITFLNAVSDWISSVVNFFFGDGSDNKTKSTNAKVTFLNDLSDWISKVINFFFGTGVDGVTGNAKVSAIFGDGTVAGNSWISKVINFFFGAGAEKASPAQAPIEAKFSVSGLTAKMQSFIENLTSKGGGNFVASITAHVTQFVTTVASAITKNAEGGFIPNGGGKVRRFASGGIPATGSLFWAGEAGAEIVGHANGGTEVLNESQIASAIASGVQGAVSQAMIPYLSQIATNTKKSADKDFKVNIGDREIARANVRGQRAMGMTLRTT